MPIVAEGNSQLHRDILLQSQNGLASGLIILTIALHKFFSGSVFILPGSLSYPVKHVCCLAVHVGRPESCPVASVPAQPYPQPIFLRMRSVRPSKDVVALQRIAYTVSPTQKTGFILFFWLYNAFHSFPSSFLAPQAAGFQCPPLCTLTPARQSAGTSL